jgi:mitogen-activated protein kinase 15
LSYTKPRFTLEEKLEGAAPDAIDLVSRLARFNPTERLTAEQALEHPYVQQFHDAAKEAQGAGIIELVLSDSEKHPIRDYRNQIYKEGLVSIDGGMGKRSPKIEARSPPEQK